MVDLDTMKPVDVKSRKQSDISAVLETWGVEVLNQIREVSMDMSGNYKGLVKNLLPCADVTVDRFHVMKLVNEELDFARKTVQKGACSAGEDSPADTASALESKDTTEKERVLASLSRSKYVLLKTEADLNDEQREKLGEVKQVSPLLSRMHNITEEFREIFETALDWGDGTLRLLDWLVEAQADFKNCTQTIKRWFGEIVGYFEQGTTNGVVEGINNKLKLIKRSGYGFRNFDNFKLRSLICWYLHVYSA